MRYSIFIFTVILLASLGSCSPRSKITKRDIRSAQKLNGLSFSRKEINTMKDYLNDNRKGYDSMRALPLDYSVTPALYFDPRPDNFAF